MALGAELPGQSLSGATEAGSTTTTNSVNNAARVTAIDVLRGITVVGMLLVNDPGDPQHVFSLLRHSVWSGCTLADLVFPFFLFVVGITTHLSLSRRAREGVDSLEVTRVIIRRAAIIFGLGLLLNAYPFFQKGVVAGPEWLPAGFGTVVARFAQLRIMGVLQRIAIAYLAASFIARKSSTRVVAITIAAVLLGYWGAMTLLTVPGEGARGLQLLNDPGRNLSAWVDRVTLDWTRWGLGWHMWDRAIPYDPEGLFSTLPSIATVLLGVLAARWLESKRQLVDQLRALALAGAFAMIIGYVWGFAFPINKPIWSSSFVLFTAGAASISLALVSWSVDILRKRRWSKPFLVFGTNPILAYVGAELLGSVLRSSIKFKADGQRIGTGLTVVRGLESVGVEARVASLIWALCFVVLCYSLLRQMHKRGIVVRV